MFGNPTLPGGMGHHWPSSSISPRLPSESQHHIYRRAWCRPWYSRSSGAQMQMALEHIQTSCILPKVAHVPRRHGHGSGQCGPVSVDYADSQTHSMRKLEVWIAIQRSKIAKSLRCSTPKTGSTKKKHLNLIRFFQQTSSYSWDLLSFAESNPVSPCWRSAHHLPWSWPGNIIPWQKNMWNIWKNQREKWILDKKNIWKHQL